MIHAFVTPATMSHTVSGARWSRQTDCGPFGKCTSSIVLLPKAYPQVRAMALTYGECEQHKTWTSPMETNGENKPSFAAQVADLNQREFADECKEWVAYVTPRGLMPHINWWPRQDTQGSLTSTHNN